MALNLAFRSEYIKFLVDFLDLASHFSIRLLLDGVSRTSSVPSVSAVSTIVRFKEGTRLAISVLIDTLS